MNARPRQPVRLSYVGGTCYSGTEEATMNIRPDLHMSKAAFIAWDAPQEGRFELVAGRVVLMPRPSLGHGLIVGNMVVALRGRLDRHQWVVISELGVDTAADTLRYPDIVVDRAGGPGKSYTAIAPALLAEVLSPSSVEIDLGDKAAEYLQIPSLLAYIVLSQDEPKAWVWARVSTDFAPGPKVVSGTEASISIAGLELELPMTEIYAGIKTG
jgi:Uma2 family endonuclease